MGLGGWDVGPIINQLESCGIHSRAQSLHGHGRFVGGLVGKHGLAETSRVGTDACGESGPKSFLRGFFLYLGNSSPSNPDYWPEL